MTSLSQTDFISAAIYQRACKSVVFVPVASVLRFIFQYSFIRLLWRHPAGGGLAAKTIYYPQSREDAQILSSSVWFQTSNRILKLVIRIRKFLGRQGMIGLVPVSVCLIVSDCFLWTHQICFLLGPKITLYSKQMSGYGPRRTSSEGFVTTRAVRSYHEALTPVYAWHNDEPHLLRLRHRHPGVWWVTRLGAANLRQPRGLGIWRTLGSECRRSCQL